MQPETMPEKPREQRDVKPHRREGRLRRFFRGYLMTVGALTTLYVLIRLLTLLFVELQKWMPPTA